MKTADEYADLAQGLLDKVTSNVTGANRERFVSKAQVYATLATAAAMKEIFKKGA